MTRIELGNLGGMTNGLMANQSEINGINGALTIVLPLLGGDDFEGGVVVTARLPDIKNKVCSPKEDRDMNVGGC